MKALDTIVSHWLSYAYHRMGRLHLSNAQWSKGILQIFRNEKKTRDSKGEYSLKETDAYIEYCIFSKVISIQISLSK